MGISGIWGAVRSVFNLLFIWFATWYAAFWLFTFSLMALSWLPPKILSFVIMGAISVLGIIALYDLTLRLRGKAHLFALFLTWLPNLRKSRLWRTAVFRATFEALPIIGIAIERSFNKVSVIAEKSFSLLFKLIGIVVAIVLVILIGRCLFGAVADLPLSVAVIIGAIIIASSVSKN
jgi:hypothetical protein